MWGQVLDYRSGCFEYRIIPTRVGTRTVLSVCVPLVWDHPHACGDKLIVELVYRQLAGSSPRVWGQEVSSLPFPSQPRIIPTRVGTSLPELVYEIDLKDHPHACGDKEMCTARYRQLLGSSPRVWGQALSNFINLSYPGIIPTRVGTS